MQVSFLIEEIKSGFAESEFPGMQALALEDRKLNKNTTTQEFYRSPAKKRRTGLFDNTNPLAYWDLQIAPVGTSWRVL